MAFLRVFLVGIFSSCFFLSISFNPIFVFLQVDIASHLLKLFEFSLSTLKDDLFERAGKIGDTALSHCYEFALSQVLLEILDHLLNHLVLKRVVQDVSI